MKKGLVFGIFLMMLIISAVFISAYMTPSGVGAEYNVELNIIKGWNLVLGFDSDLLKSDSEIKQDDILVSYVYIPDYNKYMLYDVDNPNSEFGRYVNTLSNEEIKYVEMSPIWIYSEKEGIISYRRGELSDYSEITLKTGWNFITITPEMINKNWNDIKGTCNIEKAHVWDSGSSNWIDVYNKDDLFNGAGGAGYGFIVKVSDDCTLGETSGGTAPPSLPGSEDNTGLRQEIEDYHYEEFAYESCELNPYENSGFSSEAECKETIRCMAELFGNIVKEEDLEDLKEIMEERGGESGTIEYFMEEPELEDLYEIQVKSCPNYPE